MTGFYLQPLDTRPGEFNDRRWRDKAVWGAYVTQWLDAKRLSGLDFYYIGLRDGNAVFDQGVGRQLAHTFGTRFFGDSGSWYWNAEAALQRGTFTGSRSEA